MFVEIQARADTEPLMRGAKAGSNNDSIIPVCPKPQGIAAKRIPAARICAFALMGCRTLIDMVSWVFRLFLRLHSTLKR